MDKTTSKSAYIRDNYRRRQANRPQFEIAREYFGSLGAVMFSRMGMRIVAAIVALSMLAGCAEFDRRGGVVAEVEDFVLFVAHTKSHRLFRSYLLAGVLLAAARQGGHNEADKAAIEANLKTVLDVAAEAYECLYPNLGPSPQVVLVGGTASTTNTLANVGTPLAAAFTAPAICQFFDERMARLDYALFRLALSSIFNAQSNVYLGEIRDKLIGKIPVLSATAKAAIYANKAVNEATSIVDDLLNLSFSSAGPVITLLPLYRDSLELNMWVVIDNLTRFCPSGAIATSDPYYDLSTPEARCKTLGYALMIMNNGNGDLRAWRSFIWNVNYATLSFDAYTPHFFLVTRLMWRTCQSLFGDTSLFTAPPDPKRNKCQVMLSSALIQSALQQNFVPGEAGRIYTAKTRSPTQFARQPALPPPPGAASSQTTTAPPGRDPDPTGSITQPGTSAPPR